MEDNPILQEIDAFAKLCGGNQGEFYRQMQRDAKVIKISSIYDVFTDEEIKTIKRTIMPKKKMCYKNASLLTKSFIGRQKDIKYCEGKMTVFKSFSYDHAFNKVGDKYVDITMELALGKSFDKIKDEYYVVLVECDMQELVDAEINSGVYGNVYAQRFIESYIRKESVLQ